jgi:hypothetical protein
MTNRFKALLVAAIFFALSPISSFAQSTLPVANATTPKYRVVFQVSNGDPRGWNQVLNNTLLMPKRLGKENVEVRIVAMGAGIGMLKQNSPSEKMVAASLAAGTTILACGETMTALMLEKEDMLPNIGYVPGGIKEILDRQIDGWHYMKGD